MRVGDTALLPVAQVFALAELPATHDSTEYLSTDTLSALLHAPIAVDWDELTAFITDDGILPVSRRAAREQRRTQLNALNTTPAARVAMAAKTQMLPSDLIVDYDIGTFNGLGTTGSTVQVGIGSNVLGGGLDIDWMRAGTHFHQSTLAWERSWPRQFAFRDVRVGAMSLTSDGIAGIGLFISSTPPIRGDGTAPLKLAGAPGPGWEVEAYRDDILVYAGITDSSGSYMINVPSARGVNRITVAEYGPGGEQRTINKYISMEEHMLPSGTGGYTFSIGRCMTALCNYAAQLDARYALFSRFTIGVGLTDLLSSRGHELRPSTLLATRVRDDMNATAQFSRSGSIVGFHYAPATVFDLVATYRGKATVSGFSNVFVDWPSVTVNAIWRRAPAASITASLNLIGQTITDEQRFRIGSSFVLRRAYIRPFVSVTRRANEASTQYGYGAYVESAVPFLFPSGSRIRGSTDHSRSRESFIAVAVPVPRVGQIELGAEWLQGVRVPQLTASMSLLTRAARYDAHTVTSDSRVATTHTLGGSIAITRNTHLGSATTFSSTHLRRRGEVAGTVFLDDNKNGTLERDEQPLPGVAVQIGSITVETDSIGEYHIYDLTPFEPVVLMPDSLTLPYPGLEAKPILVVPLPNGTTRVNLPATLRESGLSVASFAGVNRVSQYPESCDASSIHRNYLESGARNPNSVSNTRKPAEAREYIAPQC